MRKSETTRDAHIGAALTSLQGRRQKLGEYRNNAKDLFYRESWQLVRSIPEADFRSAEQVPKNIVIKKERREGE